MSSSSSDAQLRTRNENRGTRVDRIVIMHPDGMAVVLEIPQSRSIGHSFEQAQVFHPIPVVIREGNEDVLPITRRPGMLYQA